MRDRPVPVKAPWAVNGFGPTFFHKKVEEEIMQLNVGIATHNPVTMTNKRKKFKNFVYCQPHGKSTHPSKQQENTFCLDPL